MVTKGWGKGRYRYGVRERPLCTIDSFYSNKDGGTGLGLTITHSIIEKNKGRIEVKSETGKGTEFGVRLNNFT